MALPILAFARPFILKKHRSNIKTSIIPFSEIRKAVVLVDRKEEGWEEAVKDVQEFFERKRIEARILFPTSRELDTFGRIKRSIRYPDPKNTAEDLLISLYAIPAFEAEYEAVCSNSKLKIGRYESSFNAFNTIIMNPEDRNPSQAEVFRTMIDLISKYV